MSTLRALPPPVDRLTDRVATEVRAYMARARVNQVQLAEVLGITQSAVSNRLRGKTPFTTDDLEKVAGALGVHPAVLLGGSSGNSPQPPAGNTDWFGRNFDTQCNADRDGTDITLQPAAAVVPDVFAPVAA